MARETAPGVFSPPPGKDDFNFANFGMQYTRPVKVRSAAHPQIHKKFWFDVDPAMLALAKRVQKLELSDCDSNNKCLNRRPELVVGGNGVSGSAFVDNAARVLLAFFAAWQ